MSSGAEPDEERRPELPPSPLEMLRDRRAIVDTGVGPVAFVTVLPERKATATAHPALPELKAHLDGASRPKAK